MTHVASRRRGAGRTMAMVLFAGMATQALAACAAQPPAISGEIDERSEAMALAWKLLADNKGVDGLLIIKKPDPAIAALLKEVAAACGSAANLIAEIAAREGIPLKETGLPPAELRVRSEITAATTRELLMSSGPNFERRVLLTQVEALGYGKVLLAEVAAQLETAGLAEDAEAIAAYGATLASLRKRTVDLLEVADSERRQ